MKREVTYACGHTEEIRVFGSQEEVDAQVEALEQNCECAKCAMKVFEPMPFLEAKDALKHAKEHHLPEISGSFKQQLWAAQLRWTVLSLSDNTIWHLFELDCIALASISRYHALCEKLFAAGKIKAFRLKFVEEFRQQAFNQTEAYWWIENRTRYGCGLTDLLLRQWMDNYLDQ